MSSLNLKSEGSSIKITQNGKLDKKKVELNSENITQSASDLIQNQSASKLVKNTSQSSGKKIKEPIHSNSSCFDSKEAQLLNRINKKRKISSEDSVNKISQMSKCSKNGKMISFKINYGNSKVLKSLDVLPKKISQKPPHFNVEKKENENIVSVTYNKQDEIKKIDLSDVRTMKAKKRLSKSLDDLPLKSLQKPPHFKEKRKENTKVVSLTSNKQAQINRSEDHSKVLILKVKNKLRKFLGTRNNCKDEHLKSNNIAEKKTCSWDIFNNKGQMQRLIASLKTNSKQTRKSKLLNNELTKIHCKKTIDEAGLSCSVKRLNKQTKKDINLPYSSNIVPKTQQDQSYVNDLLNNNGKDKNSFNSQQSSTSVGVNSFSESSMKMSKVSPSKRKLETESPKRKLATESPSKRKVATESSSKKKLDTGSAEKKVKTEYSYSKKFDETESSPKRKLGTEASSFSNDASKQKKIEAPYWQKRIPKKFNVHKAKLIHKESYCKESSNVYGKCDDSIHHSEEKMEDIYVPNSGKQELLLDHPWPVHKQDSGNGMYKWSSGASPNIDSMEVDTFSVNSDKFPLHEFQSTSDIGANSDIYKYLYIIIDTNVFIDNLKLLYNIRGRLIGHQVFLKLLIPYIVLQELDNMKNKNDDVRRRAQTAIKWVNNSLTKENSYVVGQSIESHMEAKSRFGGESADDAILSCCLHHKKCNDCLIMLSNDINLRNKAIFSKINTCNAEEFKIFISKLEDCGKTNDLSNESNLNNFCQSLIQTSILTDSSKKSKDESLLPKEICSSTDSDMLSYYHIQYHDGKLPLDNSLQNDIFNSTDSDMLSYHLQSHDRRLPLDKQIATNSSKVNFEEEEDIIVSILGAVLKQAMIDAYGDLWEQIIIHKPPWSAINVLRCIKKHWIAIFIDKFPNEFKTITEQLINILSERNKNVEKKNNMNKKLILLITLICKEPDLILLKLNNNLISKIRDFTQSKGNALNSSLSSYEKEFLNTDSDNLPFSRNICKDALVSHFSTVDNNERQNNFSSCLMQDIQDGKCHQQNDSQEIATTAVKNSIIKLGEHAINLTKGLSSSISDNLDLNRFQECSTLLVSLRSLRQTLVSFGYGIKSYVDEVSALSEPVSLCKQISNYWRLAGEESPSFAYTEEDIRSLAHTNEGRSFFSFCIRDLEKIIQKIDSGIASVPSNER